MKSDFFYYALISSTVLMYGIGLNRISYMSRHLDKYFVTALKMYVVVPASSLLGWIITDKLLTPAGMVQMFPFICIILFICISACCEMLMRMAADITTAEFSISFLCTLIAVNESSTIMEVLVISLSCVTSLFLLIPLIYALRIRLSVCSLFVEFKNDSLIYIGLA